MIVPNSPFRRTRRTNGHFHNYHGQPKFSEVPLAELMPLYVHSFVEVLSGRIWCTTPSCPPRVAVRTHGVRPSLNYWIASLRRPIMAPASPNASVTLVISPETSPFYRFLTKLHIQLVPQESTSKILLVSALAE